MTTKPSKRKRFVDSLTDEQRQLMRAEFEDAERERPEILAKARRHAQELAIVQDEMRRAFESLKGIRRLHKVSLTEMAERTGMEKRELATLEGAAQPGISLLVLSRYARALGKELRISLGDAAPAVSRRKATASA
jgi:hypothetical protein